MSVYNSIYVTTKQLSNDKITFISFCCKYVVVWSRPETITVADVRNSNYQLQYRSEFYYIVL